MKVVVKQHCRVLSGSGFDDFTVSVREGSGPQITIELVAHGINIGELFSRPDRKFAIKEDTNEACPRAKVRTPKSGRN